MEEIER